MGVLQMSGSRCSGSIVLCIREILAQKCHHSWYGESVLKGKDMHCKYKELIKLHIATKESVTKASEQIFSSVNTLAAPDEFWM